MAAQLESDRHVTAHAESNPITIEAETIRVDLKRANVDISYAQSVAKDKKGFIIYDDRFTSEVLGPSPSLIQVQERDYQFAHEAGVYIKRTNSVYFTANFQTSDPIALYAVSASPPHTVQHLDYPSVHQANGACNYHDSVLYCAQGTLTQPSALVLLDPLQPRSATPLLTNFHGRPFNSINDVVVHHPTNEIWFTDPPYGHEQAFRPAPQLPAQIYRFNPATGAVAMLADRFVMCNGLCFSPDYAKLYVTDTGAVQAHTGPGDGHNFSFEPRLPATVYEYDVVDGGARVANRRVFAFCDTGVPDGIKCDERGNVYSGCGDGVHVWGPDGVLLGKIVVGGCVANFCFVRGGIWMFGEERLWFCGLAAKGALVDVEC